MSALERKERQRAGRERRIVATVRQLAEQQGWDTVANRRLAERRTKLPVDRLTMR